MNRVKKELPKYKHAWPLLYFFIYLPWFLILEQKITPDYAGLHIIHWPLDDMIPFCEWFVRPYLIWFLYIPAVFLFLFYHSKKEFYRMCAYEFTGMTIALIVYTVFPNGLNLRLTDIGRNNILVSFSSFTLAIHLLMFAQAFTFLPQFLLIFVWLKVSICRNLIQENALRKFHGFLRFSFAFQLFS